MFATEAIRRRATIQIKSVAEVEGNFGAQWQLEVIWPWSKYAGKAWLPRETFDKPSLGTHMALLERGKLVEGKDGTHEWDYRWNIVELDVQPNTQEPTSRPTPKHDVPAYWPQPKPGPTQPSTSQEAPIWQDPRQLSIERQVAFKATVDLIIAGHITAMGTVLDSAIREWTDRLAAVLSSPFPAEAAQDTEELFPDEEAAAGAAHRPSEGHEASSPDTQAALTSDAFWQWARSKDRRPHEVNALLGTPPLAWLHDNPTKTFRDIQALCAAQWGITL